MFSKQTKKDFGLNVENNLHPLFAQFFPYFKSDCFDCGNSIYYLLTGFNYNFDNDENIFTISRTKVFKPRYKFLPQQEISEMEVF